MCFNKNLLLLFCSLTIILSMIGCFKDNCTIVKSIGNETNNSMKMSYSKFSGTKFKSLQLKSEDVLQLNINVSTTSGILSIYVLTEDGTEVYNIDNPKTPLSEKINISKDGNYKIKLTADNHSGNYDINWNIINIGS